MVVGHSTTDGPFIELKVMERNFRRKGQEVEFKVSLARRSEGIYFDFMETYFLDGHLQAGFNLFRSISKQDTQQKLLNEKAPKKGTWEPAFVLVMS